MIVIAEAPCVPREFGYRGRLLSRGPRRIPMRAPAAGSPAAPSAGKRGSGHRAHAQREEFLRALEPLPKLVQIRPIGAPSMPQSQGTRFASEPLSFIVRHQLWDANVEDHSDQGVSIEVAADVDGKQTT